MAAGRVGSWKQIESDLSELSELDIYEDDSVYDGNTIDDELVMGSGLEDDTIDDLTGSFSKSTSVQSTTLPARFEEELQDSATHGAFVAAAASGTRIPMRNWQSEAAAAAVQQAGLVPVAASLPARPTSTSHMMGSSVPIAIPSLSRWLPTLQGTPPAFPTPVQPSSAAPTTITAARRPAHATAAPFAPSHPRPLPARANGVLGAGASGAAGLDAAAAFVPPHHLVSRDDFTLNIDGASPSACIKRERLRTRNAILRNTGFL